MVFNGRLDFLHIENFWIMERVFWGSFSFHGWFTKNEDGKGFVGGRFVSTLW